MYKLLDNTWDKFKCAYLGEERHRRQRHPDSTIPGLDLLDPKQAATHGGRPTAQILCGALSPAIASSSQ